MSQTVKITIDNLDQTIEVPIGQDLRTALLDNNVPLYQGIHKTFNCHGHAQCGTCQVEIVSGSEGLSDQSIYEKGRLAVPIPLKPENPKSTRLACMTRVYQDVTIRSTAVPEEVTS